MSMAPDNPPTEAAQCAAAGAARRLPGVGGVVLVSPRQRRSVADALGADRPSGAENALPPLAGLASDGKTVAGLNASAFNGKVTLVNVWASWCVPCADEVPMLEKLSKDTRIKLIGINYKDSTDNARRFLNRYGNPFVSVGVDSSGRTSIDWGVYGVPETYVVGRDGRISYKLVGPITAENFAGVLEPEIAKAAAR